MQLIRQLLSFGGVGITATVTHVLCAYLLIGNDLCGPIAANLTGALAAFGVSFAGNAALTFSVSKNLAASAARYASVSLVSAALSSAILIYTQQLSLPLTFYLIAVLLIVPPANFILSKWWAFRPGLEGELGRRS